MTDITDVHEVYKKTLHIENNHLIDVPLAVYVAKELEVPIQLIAKGVSGIGKSLFSRPLRDLSWNPKFPTKHAENKRYRIFFISRVTPSAFVSGGSKQPDLCQFLENNPALLIYSDLAPLLTEPVETRLQIFGLMRDMYDGYAKYDTGRVPRDYKNIRVNSMAFSTDIVELETEMYNLMGTREITYELPDLQDWRKAVKKRDTKENRELRNNVVKDFLDDIGDVKNDIWTYGNFDDVPNLQYKVILQYAEKASKLRASAIVDDNGYLIKHVRPEKPMRLANQLLSLYQGLRAIQLSDDKATNYILNIVQSCGTPLRTEILKQLFIYKENVEEQAPEIVYDDEGFELEEKEVAIEIHQEMVAIKKTVNQLSFELNISPTEILKQLLVLRDLKMVEPKFIVEKDKDGATTESSKTIRAKTIYSHSDVFWKPTIKHEEI